jgi:hypothetical protein
MTDLRIKDGTGSGSVVKVENTRLWTQSVMKTTLANTADVSGYSFTWGCYGKTLPGTDEYTILRIKNTDSQRHLHLHRFMLSWNGGDTNHNRCIVGAFYAGTYPPSANYTSLNPSSTNFSMQLTAPSEAQTWDGVGNGMTVATNGIKAFEHYFPQNITDVPLDGSIIVPFGISVGFTVKGEEVGKFSFLVSGWFEDTHK